MENMLFRNGIIENNFNQLIDFKLYKSQSFFSFLNSVFGILKSFYLMGKEREKKKCQRKKKVSYVIGSNKT